ncbi:hypothetical protein C8F04DRAFT_1400785 [Mycena alexandri]|uniref:F-box domain-containing protein n=1 Tax=Mycena alexandri TaxID=1745969 RepID=A0AAD6WXV9_9AGAR|nr:hypothetical protein C8F04DRAFT_1400785 [Mycena alexandri]
MGKILSVAAHFVARVLDLLQIPPAAAPRQHTSLLTLPPDILHVIFDCLLVMITERQLKHRNYFWDEGRSRGARLIPLSCTCHYLRQQTTPRIFREVSNWSKGNPRADMWPEAIRPFIAQVTLRDRSHRHPAPITISADVFAALPLMPSLNKVILRLEIPVPSQLLVALSLAPQLSSLEILQARLDGPLPPLGSRPFPSLQTLVICVWKLTAVVGARVVVADMECNDVVALLQSVSDALRTLSISGDLLSHKFLTLSWPHLRKFTITEHTPTPYLTVPEITSQMPTLRELSVLYSADLSRGAGELRPPFTIGVLGGNLLTKGSPYLNSATLSNLQPDDPIFGQLPSTLEELHVVAAWDRYIPEVSSSTETQETPLTRLTVLTTIQHISHLVALLELTLTLDHFPTPTLINFVVKTFPSLRFLALENSKYRSPQDEDLVEDVRDPALVEPLSRLANLAHLRISLDFWEREPIYLQVGANRAAARWFLDQLPTLQSISFSFEHWSAWSHFYELERFSWATYFRSEFPPWPDPPSVLPGPRHDDEVIVLEEPPE